MKSNYDKTPSFYSDEETFQKFLAQTSYYLALQTAVLKTTEILKPNHILELGSATGETTSLLAEYAGQVTGIDMRSDIVELAKENHSAPEFLVGNMEKITEIPAVENADLIVMLYSFHHIEDPLEKKQTFLRELAETKKPEANVIIAETFLGVDWELRSGEAYASVFWKALENLDSEGISSAVRAGEFSETHEALAGKLVESRDNEYLVERYWLTQEIEAAGMEVVMNQPVNVIGDALVLFK